MLSMSFGPKLVGLKSSAGMITFLFIIPTVKSDLIKLYQFGEKEGMGILPNMMNTGSPAPRPVKLSLFVQTTKYF
jgi:hypothetical protein